jgi:hypothetical protein
MKSSLAVTLCPRPPSLTEQRSQLLKYQKSYKERQKIMERQALGIATVAIVLAIILVVVVVAVGLISFASHSNDGANSSSIITSSTNSSTANVTSSTDSSGTIASSTSALTISAQTAKTASNPTNGLELRLYLNASSLSATGVNASLFADVYNPSSSTANVTSANDWVVPLNGSDGVACGDEGQTVGFGIAEGYYTSSNVTAAKLLDLVNPGVTFTCPVYFGYGNPIGDLFQPMSDSGTSYGCTGVSPCLTGDATATYDPVPVTITGYWNHGDTFASFSGGTYTVLAEDEWGALALAYFGAS